MATPGTQGKECRLSPLPRPRAATMTSSPVLGPPSFSVLRMSPGVSGEEVDLGHSLEVQEPGRALSPVPPGPQTHAQAGPRCPCPPRPHRAPALPCDSRQSPSSFWFLVSSFEAQKNWTGLSLRVFRAHEEVTLAPILLPRGLSFTFMRLDKKSWAPGLPLALPCACVRDLGPSLPFSINTIERVTQAQVIKSLNKHVLNTH